MITVAFTLGLFGGLHCVGMCGPLALSCVGPEDGSKSAIIRRAISYNVGRVISYGLLGIVFGLVGSVVLLADAQKLMSILLGAVLIAVFLLSIDLERLINSHSQVQTLYVRLRSWSSRTFSTTAQKSPLLIGLLNGFLPCGLIYLALAGALASGSILSGMAFMAVFGLGSIPVMMALILGVGSIPSKLRMQFRKLLPYATLSFGIFLIYRGMVVDMPMQLDFWHALQHPIMCH